MTSGVGYGSVPGAGGSGVGRSYTLERRLVAEHRESGLTLEAPPVVRCLAAATVWSSADEGALEKSFQLREWEFWGPGRIAGEVRELPRGSQETAFATTVGRIIGRYPATGVFGAGASGGRVAAGALRSPASA